MWPGPRELVKKIWLGLIGFLVCQVGYADSPITRDTYLIYAASTSALASAGVLPPSQAGADTSDFVYQISSASTVAYFNTSQTNYLGAQAVVSSVTYVAQTFTDGSASTGTFTVNSFTALSSATATGTSMAISSDTALAGACISGGAIGLGNFNVCNPGQWALSVVSSSQTACNIAAAIAATNVVLSTCSVGGSTGVVYSTAPTYGSIWNTFVINASTPAITSSSTFSGGRDNQTFTVNGKVFKANTDFFPVTSTAQTATNIATAITNSSVTTGVVASAGAASVVFATSTAVGVSTNYALATSSYSALSLATLVSSSVAGIGTMTNGTNSAYTINQASFSLATNSSYDTTGLAVLYGAGATAITGLTNQTTYYIIDLVPPNLFELSTTSTGSLAGIAITLASSQTKTTADSFTLTALPITGVPNYQWMVSDDQVSWAPWTTTTYGQAISSVSLGAYNSTGTITTWDLGHVSHSYVGLQVQPPPTGGLSFKLKTTGKGA